MGVKITLNHPCQGYQISEGLVCGDCVEFEQDNEVRRRRRT